MDKLIRGLKFTVKGGEGSGWFAPPKGTHGASSQGLGAKLLMEANGWTTLDADSERILLSTMAIIPDSHLEGISKIDVSSETNEYLLEHGSAGEYWSQDGTITLAHNIFPAPTLFHEVGHHVENKVFPGQIHELRTLEWDHRKATEIQPYDLGKVGLRKNSQKDMSEFWADSYMLWGMSKRGNKNALKCQPAYRETFPRMAAILDKVWEG